MLLLLSRISLYPVVSYQPGEDKSWERNWECRHSSGRRQIYRVGPNTGMKSTMSFVSTWQSTPLDEEPSTQIRSKSTFSIDQIFHLFPSDAGVKLETTPRLLIGGNRSGE